MFELPAGMFGLALPERGGRHPGVAKLSGWLAAGLLLPQNWGLACLFSPLRRACATRRSILPP